MLVMIVPGRVWAATDYWQNPGMMFRLWDYGEADNDYAKTCPDCGPAGGIFVVYWYSINPGEDNYDFSKIDDYLAKTANMRTAPTADGKTYPRPVVVQVSVSSGKYGQRDGDWTPGWVYGKGVPKMVDCSGTGIPNYGNGTWKAMYFKMIKALADRYANEPRVAAVVLGPGYEDEAYLSKGCGIPDPNPTNCKCDPVPASYFHQWLRDLVDNAGKAFRDKKPVYIGAGGEGFTWTLVDQAIIAGQRGDKVGLKSNTITDSTKNGSQMQWKKENSSDYASFLDKEEYLDIGRGWSAALKTKDLISWALEDAKGFDMGRNGGSASASVYYQWLIALSLHPDWMDWRNFPQTTKNISEDYPFFTKDFVPTYLHATKATTKGAWIAFHEVPDTKINGSDIYCWVTYQKVGTCQDHIPFDIRFYLSKVADTGSIKRYRKDFPTAAQGQVFGHARELPEGKLMSLKLEDGVWFKSGARDINYRLVLLNSGQGEVSLQFKKASGELVKERVVKGATLGEADKFVEVSGKVSGVVFNGGMEGGGDVVVKSEGGSNVVHMLEIRADGEIPVVPTNTPGVGPTVSPRPTSTTATPTRTTTPTRVPNLTPTPTGLMNPTITVRPEASPTLIPVGGAGSCPGQFNCYKMGSDYRWMASGYVMIGYTKVGDEECLGRGNNKPEYLGKEKGDANCDGKADGADYSLWRKEAKDMMKTQGKWEADFNQDGWVNDDDLRMWRRSYERWETIEIY
jgi:hypothetical protein